MLKHLLSALLMIAVFLLPTGCIAVGTNSKVHNPTLGKQLMDLKVAYEEDCITKEEYERAKANLLDDSDD